MNISVPAFWEQVNKNSGTFCWLWTGSKDDQGYGLFRRKRAHRISWELANGPIPPGKIVRHRCDNPPCVNPDHLLLGTHYDNAVDRQVSRRKYSAQVPDKLHFYHYTDGVCGKPRKSK